MQNLRTILIAALAAIGSLITSAFAALPSASAPPTVQVSEFERQKASFGATAIESFLGLAEAATKERAIFERDAAYQAILVIDPNHEEARKQLRYKKDRKTGEWVQRGYREPKPTKDAEVVAALEERRAAVVLPYVDEIIALLDEHAEALGPRRRKAELRALLVIAPDDENLREQLGFVGVERGGATVWMRVTVANALERRAEIAEVVAEAYENVGEVVEKEPSASEAALGIDWENALATERIRVLGTTSDDERTTIARNSHAQWDLMPVLFGRAMSLPSDYTMYVIEPGERGTLLDNHPGVSPEDRDYFRSVAGFNIGPAACCISAQEGVNRIDVACRQISGNYLNRAFGTGRRGWIVAGFGQYVNTHICGTHLTYSQVRTEYEDKSERRKEINLSDMPGRWYQTAEELLAKAPATRLVDVLSKDPNQMTGEDTVLAYVLAAFLTEGHDQRTVERILSKVGEVAGDKAVSSTVALEAELETTMPELQIELLEWIRAVAAAEKDAKSPR